MTADDQEATKFKVGHSNPLAELSDLRFEIDQTDLAFDVYCRLRFGRMEYERNDRLFDVGVTRAFLRLTLEGCETTLGDVFGENPLKAVEETDSLVSGTASAMGASVTASASCGATAGAEISAGLDSRRERSLTQAKTYLPVEARPGDSWEINSLSVMGSASEMIVGTAVSGERLCTIRRKQGGNRMEIVGEVQVSKRSITVAARSRNTLGRTINEWNNKDAIVAQLLKRAIQRESAAQGTDVNSSAVVISQSKALED